MIGSLFRVERGTIVHFLKWGVVFAAFLAALWLGVTLLGRSGVA